MEEGNDRRRDAWKYLLEVLSHQRRGLAIGIAVGLVWTVGKIAIPQLTRHAIDSGIERGGSVVVWAVLIGCTGLMTGTFTALRRYVAFRESRLTETRLRERLFDHILGLHIGYHDRAQTGQLMSRSSSDLNQVQAFVVMIPLTISNLALVAGVVVILFFTDPLLALVALAPLPFVNVTAKRFSAAIHPAVLAVQAEQAELATVVEETIAGVRVIKGFGAERVQSDKLRAEADDIQRVSVQAARVRVALSPGDRPAPVARADCGVGHRRPSRAQRADDRRRARRLQLLRGAARVAVANDRDDTRVGTACGSRARTRLRGAPDGPRDPRPGAARRPSRHPTSRRGEVP